MIYDLAPVTEKASSSPVVGSLLQKINLVELSFGELEAKVMALGLQNFAQNKFGGGFGGMV